MPVMLVLVLVLAACVRPPAGSKGPSDEMDGDTHTPGAIDTTEPPGTTERPSLAPAPPVPPSVVISGTPGMGFANEVGIVPPYGGDPAALFAFNSTYDDHPLPPLVILPGAIPRGEHVVTDLWDGVSGSDVRASELLVDAGDVNDDGHLDVWIGERLHHGPFFGDMIEVADARATLPEIAAYDGNFDANDDGHEDVLATRGQMQGLVFYGPFDGNILQRFDQDPTCSRLGTGICSDAGLQAVVLRDALGPGHDAAVLGKGAFGGAGDCYPVAEIFDLAVPPGTKVSDRDRVDFAVPHGERPFDSVGDLNGDGFGDLVFGDEIASWVAAGPVGTAYSLTDGPMVFTQYGGNVIRGLGDMNGDGIEELLGFHYYSSDEINVWKVLFSPYGESVDHAMGLPLGMPFYGGNAFDFKAGDLDGDGRSDVVFNRALVESDQENYGGVRIWYGSDLLAAYEVWKAPLEMESP